MSRSSHKTVNLSVDLVSRVDAVVAQPKSLFKSRDEFVRQAITILLIGVHDMAAGQAALGTMAAAIKDLQPTTTPLPLPPGLEPTPTLERLLAQSPRGSHWQTQLALEVVRQLSKKNDGQGVAETDVIEALCKLDMTPAQAHKAFNKLVRASEIYRKRGNFAPLDH